MKNKCNTDGITLIALVITIVVMLVLAGVVINYALGDSGIFEGTKKGKYMNYVQALDDTIKAYTLKNSDPYSSSKKTISDLINEGILIKITLDEDKTIYYVTDNGLHKLGLGDKLSNKTNLENEFKNEPNWADTKFKKVEDLYPYGVFVTDNDLNSAYLYKKIYGKLFNFGVNDKIANNGKYNGKLINIYPKQIVDAEQEVVILVDRTISMALDITQSGDNMPVVLDANGNFDYQAGYSKTRWSLTVDTLNKFMDEYLANNKKQKKKVTIITYYGYENGEDGEDGLALTNLGTFTEANLAKKSYSQIFTLNQYQTILDELKSKGARHCGVPRDYYSTSYSWYTGQTEYNVQIYLSNSNNRNLKNRTTASTIYKNGAPTLGSGTCTPNALKYAYEYIIGKGEEPTNVVIVTDGEPNRFRDDNNRWYSSTNRYGYGQSGKTIIRNKIREYAEKILNTNKGGYQTKLYGVAVSEDATTSTFQEDFGPFLSKYFTANDASSLEDSFDKILKDVDKGNSSIITDGKLEESYKDVKEVKIEVYKSDNKANTLITYDYLENAQYNLSDIYEDSNIDLKKAFEVMDDDPQITDEYDKIDVTIYYYGDEE